MTTTSDFMDPRPVDGSDPLGFEKDGPRPARTIELTAQEHAQRGGRFADEDEDETFVEPQPWENEAKLMEKFRSAESQATNYIDGQVRAKWARSMKAYNNEHFDNSKYKSAQFKSRSKIFRPKTRSAVRKQMASAAEALFSGHDVVAIKAQDENDRNQRASAAIKQELVNYRLDRRTRRNGIPWFRISMGARQDAALTGVCISKQTWRYRETPVLDEFGQEQIDMETGAPAVIVREDRPDIELLAPENVLFSPSANWLDPIGTSPYVIVRYCMHIEDVLDMIDANRHTAGKLRFKPLSEGDLRAMQGSKQGPTDTRSPRTARHQGADPQERSPHEFPTVWVHECFMKIGGRDVVFWTVGTTTLISNAVMVEEAYPAFHGERPLVMGVGEIQPHRVYPMASAESWQQMQQELNDHVNLRLDHFKQVVTPLAKIKRGAQVDIKQVQARGANNGVVLLNDPNADLVYETIPDVPQSAYVENNYLNTDFDDLAGTFNSGSVATNRQLNETVGGMKILAGSANAVGTFDLTVWVETWVEPVLWQIVKLEEYYEDDATLLAIAGEKAQLFERFGIDEITDALLQAETNLTVNVGMGVTNDPMERLQKFASAAQIVGQVLGPYAQAGAIKLPQINQREIIDEVFGAAGFKDASERFFFDVPDEPEQEQEGEEGPPPEMQAKMMEMQARQQQEQARMQIEQARMQQEQQKAMLDHQHRMAQVEANKYATDTRAQTAAEDRVAKIGMHHDKTMSDILSIISRLPSGPREGSQTGRRS